MGLHKDRKGDIGRQTDRKIDARKVEYLKMVFETRQGGLPKGKKAYRMKQEGLCAKDKDDWRERERERRGYYSSAGYGFSRNERVSKERKKDITKGWFFRGPDFSIFTILS